jgi:hypothetical protein
LKNRVSDFVLPPTIARCQHIKVNGVQCGSPALKRRKLCHFHQRWQQGRIQINANRARRSRYSLDLPILEDANSIQVALMQGMRLLLTNQVDSKTAALLFYALQTASTNLRHTKFEPRPQLVVIDPRGVPNTSLGDDAWYKEEFEEDEETQQEPEEETNEETNATAPGNIHATVDIRAMADDSIATPSPTVIPSKREGAKRPSGPRGICSLPPTLSSPGGRIPPWNRHFREAWRARPPVPNNHLQ